MGEDPQVGLVTPNKARFKRPVFYNPSSSQKFMQMQLWKIILCNFTTHTTRPSEERPVT